MNLSDFFSENLETRSGWVDIVKVHKGKKKNKTPQFVEDLISSKSIKNEGKFIQLGNRRKLSQQNKVH